MNIFKLTKQEINVIAGGDEPIGGCYGVDKNNNYVHIEDGLGVDTLKNLCINSACMEICLAYIGGICSLRGPRFSGWYYNGTDIDFLGFDPITNMPILGKQSGECPTSHSEL